MSNVTAAAQATLLLVDDDNQQRELCSTVLKMAGYSVLTAASPREAIALLADCAVDLAILDFEMPEMHGGQLADRIRARYRDIRIILYSGALSIPKSEIANVDVFVPKGMGAASLLAIIFELVQARTVSYGTVLGRPTILQPAGEWY